MKPGQIFKSIISSMAAILVALFQVTLAQEGGKALPPPEKPASLMLARALMCEGIKEFEPHNQTIIFPAALGQAVCFTAFDPVPEKTEIYHNWYKRDQPRASFKLTLKPPKWASFSQIRLQSSDAGPWRVDITNANGKVFKTLRFSVTE